MHYNYKKYPVNLVGSVAYHYKDIIEEVASSLGIKMGNIIQSPIEGLEIYHKTI